MSIAKNTLHNLSSHALYLLLALWGIPIIIRGIGLEQFGILALFWAVIGYFTLLDFGISKAITKYFSEVAIQQDTAARQRLIWTAINTTMAVGLLSSVLVFTAIPLGVVDVFNIDTHVQEVRYLLLITAGSIPFLLLYGTFKGFLMAIQRFDVINYLQSTLGIVQWVGAVIVVAYGGGVQGVVIISIVARLLILIITVFVLPILSPGFFSNFLVYDRGVFGRIWRYGVWVTVSQIISPLYLYIDRFFIGYFLSLGSVGLYSIPQETLTRSLAIVMSFTMALFPVLSAQSAILDGGRASKVLYEKAVRTLIVLILPVLAMFIVNAHVLVGMWLGNEIADTTVDIFQVMAIGLFFNIMAQIPNTLLQAYGRPDLPAIFQMVELPVVIILHIIMIPRFGIIGAAIVWTSRVFIDAGLHFYFVRRSLDGFRAAIDQVRHADIGLMLLVVIYGSISSVCDDATSVIAAHMLFIAVYPVIAWRFALTGPEKESLAGLFRSRPR